MASILLAHTHPHKIALTPLTKWVRTLAPPSTVAVRATATRSTVGAVGVMSSKSSAAINRKKRERDGERISVWWRDGWRVISCADFGWGGGAHDSNSNHNKPNLGKKAAFSSSSSSNNKEESNIMGEEDDDQHRHQPPPPTKLLTIPTILTLGRVAAIPVLISTFYSNSWWATTLTTSIFIIAAITDWLDGYIARKMRLGTPFGAFLDPVADKLMVAATLVLLCTRPLEVGGFGEIPWLLPIPSIAIIGREITMSAVREWAASQNGKVLEAVAVNSLGKWKTATQMTALTILLATRDTSIAGSHILVPSGVALLYISAGLSVWSLAVYMNKIWRILLKL